MKQSDTIDGVELKKIREGFGFGPVEMARAMDTPYTTYKDWENGSRVDPKDRRRNIVGRRTLKGASLRCLRFLQKYPAIAKRLAQGFG